MSSHQINLLCVKLAPILGDLGHVWAGLKRGGGGGQASLGSRKLLFWVYFLAIMMYMAYYSDFLRVVMIQWQVGFADLGINCHIFFTMIIPPCTAISYRWAVLKYSVHVASVHWSVCKMYMRTLWILYLVSNVSCICVNTRPYSLWNVSMNLIRNQR
jgi:hypothetical protein